VTVSIEQPSTGTSRQSSRDILLTQPGNTQTVVNDVDFTL
jgi:hypothetical protein